MTLLQKKSTTKSRKIPRLCCGFFFILQVRIHPASTTNMRHKESIQKEGAADGAQRVKKKKDGAK